MIAYAKRAIQNDHQFRGNPNFISYFLHELIEAYLQKLK